MRALAPTIKPFFTERLITHRQASPHTIAAYRDAVCLLLGFVEQQTWKAPATLKFEDSDAPISATFLDHLERERANSVRTRNARLSAMHSLYRFAILRHPEHAELMGRVLTIPPKRFERVIVTFLTDEQVRAILAAPDRKTFLGWRDHALLLLAIQTGHPVSELTRLTCADIAVAGRTYAASARDVSSAPHPSRPRRPPESKAGSRRGLAHRPTPCSRPVTAQR